MNRISIDSNKLMIDGRAFDCSEKAQVFAANTDITAVVAVTYDDKNKFNVSLIDIKDAGVHPAYVNYPGDSIFAKNLESLIVDREQNIGYVGAFEQATDALHEYFFDKSNHDVSRYERCCNDLLLYIDDFERNFISKSNYDVIAQAQSLDPVRSAEVELDALVDAYDIASNPLNREHYKLNGTAVILIKNHLMDVAEEYSMPTLQNIVSGNIEYKVNDAKGGIGTNDIVMTQCKSIAGSYIKENEKLNEEINSTKYIHDGLKSIRDDKNKESGRDKATEIKAQVDKNYKKEQDLGLDR